MNEKYPKTLNQKLRTSWGRWISLFLLLCLFQADAQAYIPYARDAIRKNRIESELQDLQAGHECPEEQELPANAGFESRSSVFVEASHSHIPTSVEVDITKEVGEIPYQSGTTPTGGVTYTVPVEVAPGRGGMQPQLSLAYNSQGGNGALGYGWGIGGLSAISKAPKNLYYNGVAAPVSLTTGDALMLDGMRLLPTGVANQFEPERGNLRITGSVYNGDYRSFTVEYPNGMTGIYGFPSGTTKQLSFPITRLQDALGNYMDFTYEQVDGQYYVTKIAYGAHTSSATHLAEVTFTYKNRSDNTFVYEAGRKVAFSRLLTGITCKNGSETLHTYTLAYDTTGGASLLQSLGCDNLNPLRFYYGYADNTEEEMTCDTNTLFPHFGEDVAIIASKFKLFSGETDDGMIVYPNKSPFLQYGNDRYESGYATNQALLVYGHVTDFSTPLPIEFTAGTGFQALIAGDMDGQSGDELLKINNTVVSGKDRLTVDVYKYNIVSPFGKANTFVYDGTPAKSGSFWPKRYFTGDFNGDGVAELCAVSIDKPLGQSTLRSRVYLFNPYKGTTLYSGSLSLYYNCSTDQLFPMDTNGDGKMELCHVHSGGTDVYAFGMQASGSCTFQKLFSFASLTTTFLKERKLLLGDINGDGKCDIAVSPQLTCMKTSTEYLPVYAQEECPECGYGYVADVCPHCGAELQPADCCIKCTNVLNYNHVCPQHGSDVWMDVSRYVDNGRNWSIFYADGSSFRYQEQSVVQNKGDEQYMLQDVNQDGCADLINHAGTFIHVYFAKDGCLTSRSTYKSVPFSASKSTLLLSNVALLDYYNFLLAVQGEKFYKVNETKNELKQRFLTGMTNSLGVTQHNYYQQLNDEYTQEGTEHFYERGYVSPSDFPYMTYSGPLWAVSRQDVYAEDECLSSVAYYYKGAVLHRQGLGFRGFEEVKTEDLLRSARTVTTVYNPLQYGIPVSMETHDREETYTYTVRVDANKKLTATPKITDRTDKLTGERSRLVFTYDSYGNLVSRLTYAYEGESLLVNDREKEFYQYQNLKENGHYLIGLPTVHGVQQYTNDVLCEKCDSLSYVSGTPLPATQKTFINGRKLSETRYTYDVYGNMLTKKGAAYNSTNFTGNTYTYNANGRYLSTVTDALGRTTTYHTYNKWGKPTSTTNHLGKQTTYAYDALGRNTTTVLADGATQSVSYVWNPGKGLFGVLKSATGAPDELVCYDALKREVQTGKQRFDGSWLYIDKVYDEYGRLEQVSLPFKGSAATKWNTYTYDDHDRVIRLSEASGKQTSYSYSGNSVTTTEKGIRTIRTNDHFGRLSKVETEWGEIAYEYGTDRQLKRLTAQSLVLNPDYGIGEAEEYILGGEVSTEFEYDIYGRKTKLVDPSAGTQTYSEENHADGSRVTIQTDAKGLTTKTYYDAYGRVTLVERPEFNTSYTYDSVTKALQSEVSTNGTKKEYSYDAYGRLSTEKETVDGVWLQKGYTYGNGNVSKVTYSSSKEGSIGEEHMLYANGNLSEVKLGTTSVWKLTAENELGQPTEAVTGALTRTYGYTAFGLPTLRKAGSLQHFTYQFDANTGNLFERTDVTRNLRERFSYDRLNRLDKDGWDNIDYQANGNRELVSVYDEEHVEYLDDSLYYRKPGSPYALTELENESYPERRQTFGYNAAGECVHHLAPIVGRNLRLTYNSQMRPVTLTEGGNTATFLYDASGDRKKMTITQNGATTQTKYYLGDQYETDDTKTLLYINGNAYSSPIVFRKENGAWKIYYICRDYLGSITHLANADGTLAQELSYDAWGRLRNPQTQEVYGASAQPLLKLGRGYTGHEHLSFFGLVNMNARLYDPALGRFLSPDPYVQMPDNLQNLNRYSYCLNNPLAYVDENGEFLHIIIGAAIGGLLNWASHGFKFNAKGLGYFFTGAAAGAAGGLTAGIFSAAIGGGVGFASGVLVGAGSGFSSGFIGGIGNSLVEGQGLWAGIKSGIAGGGIGALTGGVIGGITSGISALKHGGNFWTGKGSTFVNEFAVGNEDYLGGDYFTSDEAMHEFVHEGNGWEPGMYGIEDISVKTVPGDYGDSFYYRDNGVIMRSKMGVGGIPHKIAGATERTQSGLFTTKVRIHMSAHVSLAEFKGTLNHELIHAYHRMSDLPFLLGSAYHNATEYSAFTYSFFNAPSVPRALNAMIGLRSNISPYRLGWPNYLIK